MNDWEHLEGDGLPLPGQPSSVERLREIAERILEAANGLEPLDSYVFRRDDPGERTATVNSLTTVARSIYKARRRRRQHFPLVQFSDPFWDMLLDLFISTESSKEVSTTNLCLAGEVPMSTGLRCIQALEAAGLVERKQAPHDRRLSLLCLTVAGYGAMLACLAEWMNLIC